MARNVRTDYKLGLTDETGPGTKSVLNNLGLIGTSAEGLKGLLAGLAGGLSVAGIVSGLKSIVDLGDDFRDLSKQFQTTVEQVSALSFISGQSGTSVEGLAAASAKLSKNLGDISRGKGKDAADALKLIGVNAADLQKLDFAGQLGVIADGLNRIENPSQRVAASQALLGRSSRQLASLLSEGSAGINQMYESLVKVGGVITTEQGDKFDALNDSIGLFKASATGAGAAIAEKLAPPLTWLFTTLAEGGPKVSAIFSDMSNQMTKGFLQIQKTAAEFNLWVENGKGFVAEIFGGRSKGSKERASLLEAEIEILKEQIKDVEKESQDAFERQIKERETLLKKLRQGNPQADFEGGGTGTEDKEAQRRLERQKDYIDNLRQQFIVINDSSQRAKILADTLVGSAKDFSEETKQQALALADGLDFLKETTEVHEYLNDLAKERKKVNAETTAQYDKERAAIIENLQTPLEKYIATIERYRSFNFDDDTFRRGVAKANEELISAQQNTKKATDLGKELGLTFSSAFEDAVIEMRNFGDVFEALLQDMARAILRKSFTEPFTDLVSGLFSNTGGGTSGGTGGGLLSSIGTFLGNLFANSKGGLYKVGGGGGGERMVAFTAKDGEYVAVGTPGSGDAGGGGIQQVNIYQGSEPVKTRSRADGRILDIMIGNSFSSNVEGGRMVPYGIKPALTSR